MMPFSEPEISPELKETVMASFHVEPITEGSFHIEERSDKCRVIGVSAGSLITDELICDIDWSRGNGIDTERDILKLAVIERHNHTGHMGLGFIKGIGLKKGAIASSVSHDSHNLIVIGTNDRDMAVAAERICQVGGNVVVVDGEVVAEMPLKIGGLMSEKCGKDVARENEAVRDAVKSLGVNEGVEPFMNMAFVSLSVIPSLKMTTLGLLDVTRQELVSLYV